MKRPITDYTFWTEFLPKDRLWCTYFARRDDDDGEPVGADGYGGTPQESLDNAVHLAADYDDYMCKHGRDPLWCGLCENGGAE